MESIVLTIGIPVYNGGKDLERLLSSIKCQEFDQSMVQILVSDNFSTDSSVQVAVEYGCEVLVSDKNYGADRNILKTINQARGKYVWVIGHDDILVNGSINRVLGIINNLDNISSIFLNYSLVINNNMIREKFVEIEGEVLLQSKDEIISKLGIAPNFISSLIHKREKFLSCNPEKFIGTFWLQIATWLEYAHTETVVALGEPMILNAGNSEGREANTSDISLNVLESLYNFYYQYCDTQQQLRFINKIISESLIRKLFNIRKRNIAINKAKIEWTKSLKTSNISRLKIFALVYSPWMLVYCINVLYKSSGLLRRLAWARI